MERAVFKERVRDLELEIQTAIARWFERQGETYSLEEFASQTSIDMDQLAREAHFYGADLMPLEASGAEATSHRPASH